jgi:hypothetical protein
MSSSGGWFFVFLTRAFFVLLAAFAIQILLWLCPSCWFSFSCSDLVRVGAGWWSILSWSDVFWILAGFVLGLIPGMALIAYARFKAMTRYFRDTPEEAAEKAANDATEKLMALGEAKNKALAANLAVNKPKADMEAAKKGVEEAVKKATAAPDDAVLAKAADAKRALADQAESQCNTALLLSWAADEAQKAAQIAYDAAGKKVEAAALVARAETSFRAISKEVVAQARQNARAEAAKADNVAQEAAAKAAAAKEFAVQADKAFQTAKVKANSASGTAAATEAEQEARAKKKTAEEAAAEAEAASAGAAKTAQSSAEKQADLRATLLNPKGLQQTTLDKAGRIRDEELKGFKRLAILLVGICWVAFLVCWGAWLDFSPLIVNAQVALQLSSVGAYLYVVILLGRRIFQRDITPSSVLWCC